MGLEDVIKELSLFLNILRTQKMLITSCALVINVWQRFLHTFRSQQKNVQLKYDDPILFQLNYCFVIVSSDGFCFV